MATNQLQRDTSHLEHAVGVFTSILRCVITLMVPLLPSLSFAQSIIPEIPDAQFSIYEQGDLSIPCLVHMELGTSASAEAELVDEYKVVLRQTSNTSSLVFEISNPLIEDCTGFANAYMYTSHVKPSYCKTKIGTNTSVECMHPQLVFATIFGITIAPKYEGGTRLLPQYFYSMNLLRIDDIGRYVFALDPDVIKL